MTVTVYAPAYFSRAVLSGVYGAITLKALINHPPFLLISKSVRYAAAALLYALPVICKTVS